MSAQIYLLIFSIVSVITILFSLFLTYFVMKKEYSKKIKLDISLEQMLLSEKRIEVFLKENNLEVGESIHNIAKALNIVEGGEERYLLERARLNKPDKTGIMTVVFKAGLTKEERLFDFAHECGHRINLDPTPATRPEGYNKPENEQLADYVGAALLMPLDNVYEYLVKNGYENGNYRKRAKLLRALCEKYGVSEVIALRRVTEVFVVKRSKIKK